MIMIGGGGYFVKNKVTTPILKHHNSISYYYNYLFSGLLRCGKCGELLQGKSAYSRTGKRHYYYSHKNTCLEREARNSSALTQQELAMKLDTTKGAISRIENHAEDIKLSTLKKVAEALGKKLTIRIS
jgi:HTH-type transcriptional regulator/antitoxin HipB